MQEQLPEDLANKSHTDTLRRSILKVHRKAFSQVNSPAGMGNTSANKCSMHGQEKMERHKIQMQSV